MVNQNLEDKLEPTVFYDSAEAYKEICINLSIAYLRRKEEIEKGLGLKDTKGFEATGCFKCDGYEKKCSKYDYFRNYEGVK